MTRVSIIEFCDDMKKHSIGLSSNEIAINKITCGRRRVLRLQGQEGSRVRENFEPEFDEDEILDNGEYLVPDCVENGDCIDMKAVADWSKDAGNKVGETITNGLVGMITGLLGGFTGDGNFDILVSILVEELGEKLLIKLGTKVFNSAMTKSLSIACQKGVSFAAMNISRMFVFSQSIATNVATKAAASAAIKGGQVAAETGASSAAAAAGVGVSCPPCAPFLLLVMVFQISSMIFDMWDPFGCNDGTQTVKMFNHELLETIEEALNTMFRDTYLARFSGGTEMPDGSVVGVENRWPIEYDIMGVGDTDLIIPHNDTIVKVGGLPLVDDDGEPIEYSWLALTFILSSRYMGSLTRNSYGQKIQFGPNKEGDRLFTFRDIDLSKLRGKFALQLSNNNTSLAKWIYAWWPLLLFVFFILVFVIIKLIT